MAGLGYKNFTVGQVLTSAEVDGYLMEQAVMRFASASARNTALTGVLAEGMIAYLMDTDAVEKYDGTDWVALVAGDIESVTAGNGLSGGGSSGAVSLAIDTAITADLSTAQVLSNKILRSPEERATVAAIAATGTIAFDALTQGVLFYTTNASGNATLNFRASSGATLDSILATGDSITLAFLQTNGATAYYPSAYQIDGSAVTPKWQGGTAPSAGNASSIDAYSFTIIKTGSATYTVLASQTRFA